MYWTCWGGDALIEKASMDGTDRTVLHNTSLAWPNALTLDIATQTLYWADASLDKVEASDTDGNNRRLITTSGVLHPFALAVFNSTLYMTDWIGNSLKVISGFEGDAVTAVEFCNRPNGVKVIHPSLQPFG